MGRPRNFSNRLMKPADYKYDFPENRELARLLTSDEKKQIVKITGCNIRYLYQWGQGKRRGEKITKAAKNIIALRNSSSSI